MTIDTFQHSLAIEALLDQGKRKEATFLHNAHVKEQFKKARAGETICLTDLMAAKELLQQDT